MGKVKLTVDDVSIILQKYFVAINLIKAKCDFLQVFFKMKAFFFAKKS